MSITEQGPGKGRLRRRIGNILFSPSEEWDRIETEPATIKGLYLGYAGILAAIGPVARLIGGQVFGYRGLFQAYRPGLLSSIGSAIVDYGLSLAGVFVLALAIDALAPSFGGTRSLIQALKVAVCAWTAAWIFAVFQIAPPVSALSVIGVYSLYLLYLGVPKLMKAPPAKAPVYSVLAIAVALAIWAVVQIIADALVSTSPVTTAT